MGLIGRPRDYAPDRPATGAERAVRFRQRLKEQREAAAQEPPVTPRMARRRAAQAAQEAQATGAVHHVTPTVTLLCKAIEDVTDDDVAPGSLDCIVTDPPYGRAFLPLFGALGRFAVRYLKSGGTLATQHGDVFLADVVRLLGAHAALQFQVQLLWHLHGNATAASMRTGYSYFTKSVLVYRKAPWRPLRYNQPNYWSLPQTAGRTTFHAWGQQPSGIAEVFRRVTTPGMRVCDPFVGGGTTVVVALAHHCHVLGIDKDPAHIETIKARLATALTAPAAAD